MDSLPGSPGRERARSLLFSVPQRFQEFAKMDQKSFCVLADWIQQNIAPEISADISIEESLFVFLDIAAQGNSFNNVACQWQHDIQLTQSIFLNMLNALTVLRERTEIPEPCSLTKQTRRRWSISKSIPKNRSRADGLMKVGFDDSSRDGLEVNQETLMQAITACDKFLAEAELDDD